MWEQKEYETGIVHIDIIETSIDVSMTNQCQIIITVGIPVCNTIKLISYILNNKAKIHLIYIRLLSLDNNEPNELP